MSTSTNRPGCSDCADRTRPHNAAPSGAVCEATTSSTPSPSASQRWIASRPSPTTSATGRPETAGSNTAGSTPPGPDGTDTGTQRNAKSESAGSRESSTAIDRTVRVSTVATGWPDVSVRVMATPSPAVATMRTRRREAPTANSDRPFQANGTLEVCSPDRSSEACSAASKSAGCRAYRSESASSSAGSSTSAKISSPRRQAARNPWNAGP